MATMKELQERRNLLADRVKSMAKRFEANGKRWQSDEERASWDQVNADYNDICAEQDVLKHAEKVACDQAAKDAARDRTPYSWDADNEHDGISFSDKPFAEFDDLLRSRKAGRIEVRDSTTTVAGATTAVTSGAGMASPYLTDRCGVQVQSPGGLNIESPFFAALTARAATAEGGTKPVHGDPTLKSTSLAAYAVVHTISDQVATYGVGTGVFGRRLQNEVVYSINDADAAAFETQAGTPIVFVAGKSAGYMVDLGVATVSDLTGNLPSAILVNPADYPELADKVARGSGSDIGSRVVSWNGVPLFAHNTITADVAVVVDGMGWRAFRSAMKLDSDPKLETNELLIRAEQYAALIPLYENCSRAVALA